MMIAIDVLLSEEQIANEFLAALARRQLPEKFFYWLPLSVKAWLELCRSREYKNFARSLRLVSDRAEKMARHIAGPAVEVISLGSGQGDKDLVLLQALRKAGREVSYRPVDSSQALLELACSSAVEAGFRTRGLKADLHALGETFAAQAASERARLFLLLGNTLGGFDPLEFVQVLSRLVAPGAWLLLDGEIYGGAETMTGYDHPINRNFASAPLRSIGLGDEQGELSLELAADPRRAGLHPVRKYFRVGRDVDVVVAGERLHFDRGETIHMSSSYKYTRATFLELVTRDIGLEVVEEFLSEDERFVMVLARREGGRAG